MGAEAVALLSVAAVAHRLGIAPGHAAHLGPPLRPGTGRARPGCAPPVRPRGPGAARGDAGPGHRRRRPGGSSPHRAGAGAGRRARRTAAVPGPVGQLPSRPAPELSTTEADSGDGSGGSCGPRPRCTARRSPRSSSHELARTGVIQTWERVDRPRPDRRGGALGEPEGGGGGRAPAGGLHHHRPAPAPAVRRRRQCGCSAGAAGLRPRGPARPAAAGPRGGARRARATRAGCSGLPCPKEALAAAVRRTGPAALFVWSQRRETGDPALLEALPMTRPPTRSSSVARAGRRSCPRACARATTSARRWTSMGRPLRGKPLASCG